MHRFSPFSNGGIKKTKKIKKKKLTKEQIDNNLIDKLLSMGFSYERSIGCLSYLERKTLNNALDFFENIEPKLL
tara:strand:- start:2 stop:223 length:222 start_codon:yes stop_codon:yes gene_type:complete